MQALVAVGVPEAQARRAVATQFDEAESDGAPVGGDVGVLAQNWPAVRVFLALGTQWRLAPMGGATGLDYGPIPGVLVMMGLRRREWPETFERLRVMEAAALEVIRARQARQAR